MSTIDVKFGDWIEKGWNVFKENAVLLILTNLVAVLLTVVTGGILAGPMMAGVILVTLAVIDKKDPKPVVGDLFKGFDVFLQSFLFYLVFVGGLIVLSLLLSMIPCVGSLLATAASFAISTLVMFSMFLITERKMEFWPAVMQSYTWVKDNIWPFLGFYIVSAIIGEIGAVFCCVGLFVTLPIYWCILAVAYREIVSRPEAVTTTPAA